MATKRWLGNTGYELGRTRRYESFSRVSARDFSTSFQWENAFKSINQSINQSSGKNNLLLPSRKTGVPFETAALMAEEKSVTNTFFAPRLRAKQGCKHTK